MRVTEEVLQEINGKLSDSGVEHKARPLEAIRLLSKDYGISVSITSESSNFIFKWFKENSKPGSQLTGHYYEGAYFYDSEFWSVGIPIIFGSTQINSIDALHQMPENIKEQLKADRKQAWDYVYFFADCIDFGMGYSELINNSSLDEFGLNFLKAGYEEITSATSLLLENRPNTRAIMNCRMATEMFFKSFISFKVGLSQKMAKDLGHNLTKLMDKFIECSGYNHLNQIKPALSVFPEIKGRYEQQKASRQKLFEAYSFAQSIGTLIIREFTNINTLKQVMPSNKPINTPSGGLGQ